MLRSGGEYTTEARGPSRRKLFINIPRKQHKNNMKHHLLWPLRFVRPRSTTDITRFKLQELSSCRGISDSLFEIVKVAKRTAA